MNIMYCSGEPRNVYRLLAPDCGQAFMGSAYLYVPNKIIQVTCPRLSITLILEDFFITFECQNDGRIINFIELDI